MEDKRVADFWSAYLGVTVSPSEVIRLVDVYDRLVRVPTPIGEPPAIPAEKPRKQAKPEASTTPAKRKSKGGFQMKPHARNVKLTLEQKGWTKWMSFNTTATRRQLTSYFGVHIQPSMVHNGRLYPWVDPVEPPTSVQNRILSS